MTGDYCLKSFECEPTVSKKKREKSKFSFVQVFHWVMKTPAWQDLSLQARAVYVELKSLYNGSNNGRLGLGVRQAGKVTGMSISSANRFLRELEDHGFIVRQRESSFGQKKLTIEWRLTELKNDVTLELATKDFRNWEPSDKKQKSVPLVKTSVPPAKLSGQVSVPMPNISLTNATVTVDLDLAQSHRRDTSRSKPDGGKEYQRTRTQFRFGRAALVDALKEVLRAQHSVPPESVTAMAIRLCDEIEIDVLSDPLACSLLGIFPGSSPAFNRKYLVAEVNRRLPVIREAEI